MSAVFMLASYSWIGWGPFTWTILTIVLVVYYWMWSQSRTVKLVNALPGPDFLPFLGNFLDFNVDLDGVCVCVCTGFIFFCVFLCYRVL